MRFAHPLRGAERDGEMKSLSLLMARFLYGASTLVWISLGLPSPVERSDLEHWAFAGLLAAKACFWMLVHIACLWENKEVAK